MYVGLKESSLKIVKKKKKMWNKKALVLTLNH